MSSIAPAEHLWFLDTLVTIRLSHRQGSDGIAILEHRAPHGDSPPMHVHRTEDEVFIILEGAFRFRLGQTDHRVTAGETLLAPKGIPHTYRVESPDGGRLLTITARGDFERFVRAVGRAAERIDLPPRGGPPTPEAAAALAEIAARHGIDLAGPPLQ